MPYPTSIVVRRFTEKRSSNFFRALPVPHKNPNFPNKNKGKKRCVHGLVKLCNNYTCLLSTGGHVHVGLVGKERRLSLGAAESRPSIWVAYRELFTPRLRSSAGSGKRRRREGPTGPTNWLVLILGRLENYLFIPVPLEPEPTLANIPLNTETKDKRNEIDKQTGNNRLNIDEHAKRPQLTLRVNCGVAPIPRHAEVKLSCPPLHPAHWR